MTFDMATHESLSLFCCTDDSFVFLHQGPDHMKRIPAGSVGLECTRNSPSLTSTSIPHPTAATTTTITICHTFHICVRGQSSMQVNDKFQFLKEVHEQLPRPAHWKTSCYTRGEFRPRQTRQLPRAVDLKGQLLSCQNY